MGFFGGYVFDGRTWHGFDLDSEQRLDIVAPWLSVYIHDSDIATVRYEPHGPGSGTAYLGCTPRTYLDDESASEPTDVLREAEGLALWLTRQQNRNDVSAETPSSVCRHRRKMQAWGSFGAWKPRLATAMLARPSWLSTPGRGPA